MQLAISSNSLSDHSAEAITRARDLGFTHIELNLLDYEFEYGYRRRPNVRFYRDLKTQLAASELSVWSVTAPELSARQMFSEKARRDILINGVGAAGILGAGVFVIEPYHAFVDEARFTKYVDSNLAPPTIDGFDEAWAQAVNRRLGIAMRNVAYWIGQPLTNNPARMERTTFDLGVGWAADLRLANNFGKLDDWLVKLTERLAVAYANDVADDGETAVTPTDDSWAAHIATLSQTRLKTLVLNGHPDQSDDEFIAARTQFEAWINA